MSKLVYFLIFIIVFSLHACHSPKNKESQLTKEIQSPKELFSSHCVSCHGADGTLGMSGAKNLQLSTLDKESITNQITKGKGMMTGFEGKLSSKEIDDLTNYVITLRK